MPDINLDNIGGESCEPVAGISTDLLFIEQSHFESMAEPKDLCDDSVSTTLDLEEFVIISGTPGHVLKAGKKWAKLPFVQETGTIKSTQIGDFPRRLIQNETGGQVAGSAPSLLGFMRWVKNKRLVVLVKEIGTKNYRQLGSMDFAARVETQEHLIEGSMEGLNALNITIIDKQKYPAPIYKGEIVTTVPPVGG